MPHVNLIRKVVYDFELKDSTSFGNFANSSIIMIRTLKQKIERESSGVEPIQIRCCFPIFILAY